jgi:hypothetical protein
LGHVKVISKVGFNPYRLCLPKGCCLHPVLHCDLLSHASSATSLRHHHTKIEGDHEEYASDFISDVKIDNWTRRKVPYLQLLAHFVSFAIPKWMLLEQVDEKE